MAVLNETDCRACWADFMAECSRDREIVAGLTKVELRAAFDAVDEWINANAAALNSAIPQPARWGAQFERSNTDLDSDSFAAAKTAGTTTNGTSGILNVTEIAFADGAAIEAASGGGGGGGGVE